MNYRRISLRNVVLTANCILRIYVLNILNTCSLYLMSSIEISAQPAAANTKIMWKHDKSLFHFWFYSFVRNYLMFPNSTVFVFQSDDVELGWLFNSRQDLWKLEGKRFPKVHRTSSLVECSILNKEAWQIDHFGKLTTLILIVKVTWFVMLWSSVAGKTIPSFFT